MATPLPPMSNPDRTARAFAARAGVARFLGRRAAWAIFTLWLLSVLVFAGGQLLPGDIGRAVLGVVVAEFFGSQEGLGVVMVRAASSFKVDVVFAGLIVFAALSLIMTGLVKLLENRLSSWRPQHSNAE